MVGCHPTAFQSAPLRIASPTGLWEAVAVTCTAGDPALPCAQFVSGVPLLLAVNQTCSWLFPGSGLAPCPQGGSRCFRKELPAYVFTGAHTCVCRVTLASG